MPLEEKDLQNSSLHLNITDSIDFDMEIVKADAKSFEKELCQEIPSVFTEKERENFDKELGDTESSATQSLNLSLKNSLRGRQSSSTITLSDSSDNESDVGNKITPQKVVDKSAGDDDDDDKENAAIWTLKHPKDDNTGNLVELIKGYGIYVNKTALNAISTQNKQTTLARALMKIVFKTDALEKCTIRGKTGKRPGLHQKGVNTILSYVRQFAKKYEWPNMDEQKIITSLSRRVVEKNQKRFIFDSMAQVKQEPSSL